MTSVRARLAFAFAGITGVILAVFCASLYAWAKDRSDAEARRRLGVGQREFVAYFLEEQDEVRRGVHPSLDAVLGDFARVNGLEIDVRAQDGSTVYRSPGFDPAGPHPVCAIGTVEAATAGGARFRITVKVDAEDTQRRLGELRVYFATFCPLMLVLAWVAGYLFVGRALSPVEEMRQQAERISRENLSERVPEPGSTGEFRNLARTFNEMLDRLDRAFQDLQQFAADAAHELRTPLANLRATIETTIQEPHPGEEYERVLASVSEEVARMNRIVADLFMLAKIDMRQYALAKERVALGALLSEARDTWQACAAERGIRIAIAGGDAEVAGDPVALRRVFMNLVENAIKYNRDGGTVNIVLERVDGRARVRVSDTGIGIPEEHVPKLFRRFYRVDKARSRETGGAGLGLAICKSFVEAHEGKIDVASVPGRGTTFTVELPTV